MHRSRDFLSMVGRIAEDRQREDQLSNTFEACFNESPAFRNAVVALLRKKHGLPQSEHPCEHYTCKTQQSAGNRHSRSRYDIVIYSADRPAFTLENKLEARLTKDQLSKYQTAGGKRLTAVTRHFPDVPLRWLRDKRIRCVRWHDLHRAISLAQKPRPVDRFVCDAFVFYLEGRGMAFRRITLRDIRDIADTFRTITEPKPNGFVNNIGFTAAGDLLELLQEAKLELEDLFSRRHRISGGWGPGYYNDDEAHYLGFGLRRSKPPSIYKHRRIEVYIKFPRLPKGEATLQVYAWDTQEQKIINDFWKESSVRRFIDGSETLDSSMLVEAVRSWVERWRPRLRFL